MRLFDSHRGTSGITSLLTVAALIPAWIAVAITLWSSFTTATRLDQLQCTPPEHRCSAPDTRERPPETRVSRLNDLKT